MNRIIFNKIEDFNNYFSKEVEWILRKTDLNLDYTFLNRNISIFIDKFFEEKELEDLKFFLFNYAVYFDKIYFQDFTIYMILKDTDYLNKLCFLASDLDIFDKNFIKNLNIKVEEYGDNC